MPQGGDRRPLVSATDIDQQHAALLLQTMYEYDGPAGRKFRTEFADLFQRFNRLVRFLNHWPLPGRGTGTPGELRELEKWIGQLTRPWSTHYPRARPLTPSLQVEFERRQELCTQWTSEVMRTWPEELGPAEQDPDYIAVLEEIWNWSMEVHREANPQRRRTSRRVIAGRYIDAVREFAERWGLRAWWGVPAIVHSHSLRASIGSEAPMVLYGLGVQLVQSCTLMVRLPGTTDEDFERDSVFFRELHLELPYTFDDGLRCSIKRRPDRDELARIEHRENASTVTLHWEPMREQHPADKILRACELRLDRPLTYRERRNIRGQLDPQLRAARGELARSSEWEPASNADIETHARWTAIRLLEPDRTWAEIARRDTLDGLGLVHDATVRQAVKLFTERAGLELS